MPPRKPDMRLTRPRDVAVFVSPARQELFAAVGLHGPATVAELAHHLGRAPTALYHHLAQLARVGAIVVDERRRSDGRRERTYRAAVERVSIGRGRGRASVRAQQAAAAASLRLTARELARAIADPDLRRSGSEPQVIALRGKGWLSQADLRAVQGHARAIEALLRASATRRPGRNPFAVSLVLAPIPQALGRRRAR
jgi:predicted transcriptional regulator